MDVNTVASLGTSGTTDFGDPLSFAPSGPVFDLPAGWTANSISGNIVDNRFVGAAVPEPGALTLLASGALSMLGLAAEPGGRGPPAGVWASRCTQEVCNSGSPTPGQFANRIHCYSRPGQPPCVWELDSGCLFKPAPEGSGHGSAAELLRICAGFLGLGGHGRDN